jgi:hypothetical protein
MVDNQLQKHLGAWPVQREILTFSFQKILLVKCLCQHYCQTELAS